MQISIPHQFTKQQAKERIETALKEAHAKLEGPNASEMTQGASVSIVEERWDGDTLYFAFTVQKQHISGKVVVEDKAYDVEAKLPLMLRMFEGKIQRAIAEQVAAMSKK